MDNSDQQKPISAIPPISDDFLALHRTFGLPVFHYVDIARQARIPELLARWPLLSELSARPDDGESV